MSAVYRKTQCMSTTHNKLSIYDINQYCIDNNIVFLDDEYKSNALFAPPHRLS